MSTLDVRCVVVQFVPDLEAKKVFTDDLLAVYMTARVCV